MLGKHCPKLPTLAMHNNCLLSYLTMGGPDKEHETNKLLPVRRIWEGTKGRRRCQPITSQKPLRHEHTTRKDPESDQIWAQAR